MKSIIKLFFFLCVFAATFMSCETYSDPKVDYTPIYPLSGEWRVRITNLTTNALISSSMYTFVTYNTSDYSSTQMWIQTTPGITVFSPATSVPRTLRSKISCDVAGLSFSTTQVTQNLNIAASSSWPLYAVNAVIDTVTITGGQVTLNSVAMPSGVNSDRIYFKLQKTKAPGVTYLVEGYRTTRWNEDASFITFK